MKCAVVVFPGSNCDRDMAVALARAAGRPPEMVWHKDADLPADTDLVALPGGFSYGDYLRCGAIASQSPIMDAVRRHAARGGYVLGVCNGFQVLTESGLLPGVLMRNAGLKFVCRSVGLTVAADGPFTCGYDLGSEIRLPVAHHDGCYVADDSTLAMLDGDGRVAFRYSEPVNGSMNAIAGVLSDNHRVLGMMPHPERATDPDIESNDGAPLFSGLMETMDA